MASRPEVLLKLRLSLIAISLLSFNCSSTIPIPMVPHDSVDSSSYHWESGIPVFNSIADSTIAAFSAQTRGSEIEMDIYIRNSSESAIEISESSIAVFGFVTDEK